MSRLAVLLALILTVPAVAQDFKLPANFRVAEFAGPSLANDVIGMTLDPRGRVVVSGPGYIRILVDDDKNGVADRAIEFAKEPKSGCHGMIWKGDTLTFVGDDGLRQLIDKNGDDKADGPSKLIKKLATGNEHGSHGIKRGPDGWLYLAAGDHGGIDDSFAQLPTSPVKFPIAGCVVRFHPTTFQSEIVAHGFRNIYGLDFDSVGRLWTYDSDNERCIGMPWYEPTRLYQVVEGGFYGWFGPKFTSRLWRLPPYSPETIAPAATFGRGSPTFVLAVDGAKENRLLLGDWTFGRVHQFDLRTRSLPPAPESSTFLEARSGFAPTAAAFDAKTGDVFITIGGRGTRGAVYRVSGFGARSDKTPPAKLDLRESAKTDAKVADLAHRAANGDDLPLEPILDLLKSKDERRELMALCLLQRRWELPAEPGPRWEGYSGKSPDADVPQVAETLLRLVAQSKAGPHRRELARTLAVAGTAEGAADIVAWLSAESDPIESFHLLATLAHASPQVGKGESSRVADALIRLDADYEKRQVPRESNWPVRFGELATMLLKRDPALGKAIVAHPDFGRPEHAALASVNGFPKAEAVPVFVKRLRADAEYALSGKTLNLIADLPGEELAALLRPHVGKSGIDDALLPFLARKPVAGDRTLFVAGLKSLQPKTVRISFDALDILQQPTDDDELLALYAAFKNADDSPKSLRHDVARRWQKLVGGDVKDAASFEAWLAKNRPDHAKRLAFADGVDRPAWQKRLDAIDWAKGDADRGKAFYTKASCAACHAGAQTIGPDLAGVAGRFRRDDLFTAILQPNKDVNDRYRTVQIVTTDGKVHRGLVVYSAFDGVLLRTGPADTVRVDGKMIESRATVAQSLMPTALLDQASDGDLADLYAYLLTLKAK